MFTYMIVVNDNGELKPVSQDEFERAGEAIKGSTRFDDLVESALNNVLDQRSADLHGVLAHGGDVAISAAADPVFTESDD